MQSTIKSESFSIQKYHLTWKSKKARIVSDTEWKSMKITPSYRENLSWMEAKKVFNISNSSPSSGSDNSNCGYSELLWFECFSWIQMQKICKSFKIKKDLSKNKY